MSSRANLSLVLQISSNSAYASREACICGGRRSGAGYFHTALVHSAVRKYSAAELLCTSNPVSRETEEEYLSIMMQFDGRREHFALRPVVQRNLWHIAVERAVRARRLRVECRRSLHEHQHGAAPRGVHRHSQHSQCKERPLEERRRGRNSRRESRQAPPSGNQESQGGEGKEITRRGSVRNHDSPP